MHPVSRPTGSPQMRALLKRKREAFNRACQPPRFELYLGADRRWYWRFVERGEILAIGGQGYATRAQALQDIHTTRRTWLDAPIVDV